MVTPPDATPPELEPGPLPAEVPDAAEVIATARAVYAAAPTYVDRGVVKHVYSTGFDQALTFAIAYERGGRFRFEYRKQQEPKQHYIVWSDGSKVLSSWTVQPGLRTWPDLEQALDAAAGVSSRTSIMTPRMLMPDELGGRKPIRRARIAGLDRVDGHPSWRIVVEDLPSRNGARTLEETIWIDQRLHLLRRRFDRTAFAGDRGTPSFEASQTTRFSPVIGERIDVALLEPPR